MIQSRAFDSCIWFSADLLLNRKKCFFPFEEPKMAYCIDCEAVIRFAAMHSGSTWRIFFHFTRSSFMLSSHFRHRVPSRYPGIDEYSGRPLVGIDFHHQRSSIHSFIHRFVRSFDVFHSRCSGKFRGGDELSTPIRFPPKRPKHAKHPRRPQLPRVRPTPTFWRPRHTDGPSSSLPLKLGRCPSRSFSQEGFRWLLRILLRS